MKKKICILGSTGSIGRQTLEVIAQHPDKFEVSVLTAYNNTALLIEQALQFKPNVVVVGNESKYAEVEEILWKEDIKTYAGAKAIADVVQMDEIDLVVSAIIGFAGLNPVLSAIDAKKNIALANKETLVAAGHLITQNALEKGVNIYPVDSEHSAIFQCITGEFHNPIEKVYLTASGGPFKGFSEVDLAKVSVEQAIQHPNWKMGQKISVDCATLMNKGFEVIEAKWMFALKPDQIEVIIHPESIVHSMVQFQDGAIKTQMGIPDMKQPIQFALSYPERLKSKTKRFDFSQMQQLTFERIEKEDYPHLELAYEALKMGGNAPASLNAANELAVAQFLKGEISFLDIYKINAQVLKSVDFIANPTISDLEFTDEVARRLAVETCP